MIIGIPRSLFYYKYGTLIKTFFNELGIDYVISNPSNKKILEDVKTLATSERCMNLKLFLGHVKDLENKCNFLFIPRFESVNKGEKLCTNFYLLPDLVRNIFEEHIIDFNVNVNKGKTMKSAFIELGLYLGFSYNETVNAYKKALETDKKVKNNLLLKQTNTLNNSNKKILIVGHSYNIYDEMIGKPIINTLEENNFSIIYADICDEKEKNDELSSSIYFTYNKELIRAINYYKEYVDGIIIISAFPCGPDSIVNDLIIRKTKDIPIINLIIDEVSSNTGILTRLESFMDIINKESAYGK